MEIQIQLVVQPCGSDWETPASPGKMIYSHHPQSLLTVLTTPDFLPPETQKNIFLSQIWGRSIRCVHISSQERQECPWIDLIFCTFLHGHQSFFSFMARLYCPPRPNLFLCWDQTMLRKWLQLARTAIICLQATLFIIGCTQWGTYVILGVTSQRWWWSNKSLSHNPILSVINKWQL